MFHSIFLCSFSFSFFRLKTECSSQMYSRADSKVSIFHLIRITNRFYDDNFSCAHSTPFVKYSPTGLLLLCFSFFIGIQLSRKNQCDMSPPAWQVSRKDSRKGCRVSFKNTVSLEQYRSQSPKLNILFLCSSQIKLTKEQRLTER